MISKWEGVTGSRPYVFDFQRVVELSKKHLQHMAVGFENPKVKVHIKDGMEFMLENKKAFDVVITDSSDPVGMYDTW